MVNSKTIRFCMTNNIISTYAELVKLLKQSKEKGSFVLRDIDIPFELDLHKLFIDTGSCQKVDNECPLDLACPVLLEGINCKSLLVTFINISNAGKHFKIIGSHIDSLWIHTCNLNSLKIEHSSISKLSVFDSSIYEDVCFDFSNLQPTSPVKIDFEGTIFGGNVKVSNLKMIDENSEFNISEEKSIIKGDFLLNNLIITKGIIDLSCNFEQNCIFRKINSGFDVYENPISFNVGTISLNGGRIGKDFILDYCHLHSLSIANTSIGGIHEWNFSYNQLNNDAPILFRNAAITKNDILLAEKYTADVFDSHLKNNSVITLRRWANYLNNKALWRLHHQNGFFYRVWEAVILFVPSLFSSEGILLWLNKYSNNYNRSWFRGIVFTLITTLLSYFILNFFGMESPYFVFDIHFTDFGEVVKGYMSLLDVFNLTGINSIISFELTTWGYIILFVSKILITYGFWQTIYAFFRYRK